MKGKTAQIPAMGTKGSATETVTVYASIQAVVPDIKLWWPLHYGAPNLHHLTAQVTWEVGFSLCFCDFQSKNAFLP